MHFGRKTDNGPSPQAQEPADYAPKPKRYAEEAARAAQHVIDLEAHLKELEAQGASLRGAFEAVKHDNARLEDRLVKVTEERDLYKNRVADIEARFDDAAQILLKVIDRRLTREIKPVDVDMTKLAEEVNVQPPNS